MLGLGTRCIYAGTRTSPMLPGAYNNFKKIIQTETQVVILVEWMHWARVIRLDAKGRQRHSITVCNPMVQISEQYPNY